ncbi:MAG TPA: A/G-specific adenine glycosylase [Acidimicrobiia bacterium]|nr:A/G-specific adenine glycosylase [Acidimicrobiia bacterium]
MTAALTRWYREHGRHALPWRSTRDRWTVLVSEVMLQQTQVPRVTAVFDAFMEEFPTPAATAAAGPAAVITAWGRLGYPRRARRLWEAAVRITDHGWPADLSELPGVGRYTSAAIAAQVDDDDRVGIEVNLRRVCERVRGERLGDSEAEECVREIARGLSPRDRLLAVMDLGATVCTARAPDCKHCPIVARCATRGTHEQETKHRQSRFEGSFRQRRGNVMARLRVGPVAAAELDGEVLASLLDDGLAEVTRGRAHLPRPPRPESSRAGGGHRR